MTSLLLVGTRVMMRLGTMWISCTKKWQGMVVVMLLLIQWPTQPTHQQVGSVDCMNVGCLHGCVACMVIVEPLVSAYMCHFQRNA